MKWSKNARAFFFCGMAIGGISNLWITLVNPWAGLFIPSLLGVVAMRFVTEANK